MLYILEFSRPLGNPESPYGQARYYMGYCQDNRLVQRLKEHRSGYGAAITRAAVQRGIEITLVGLALGDREDERRWKRWKNHRKVLRAWEKGNKHHGIL